jgi:hypothetical protein
MDFSTCKTCPPEFSARKHRKRESASVSLETAAPSEVFPLARLCFQRPFGLRPTLHEAEKR